LFDLAEGMCSNPQIDANWSNATYSVLGLAIMKECPPSLIKALVRRGADVNLPNAHGYTPVHSAICLENAELVDALLSLGADLSIPKNVKRAVHDNIWDEYDEDDRRPKPQGRVTYVDTGVQVTPLESALYLKNGPILSKLVKYQKQMKGSVLEKLYSIGEPALTLELMKRFPGSFQQRNLLHLVQDRKFACITAVLGAGKGYTLNDSTEGGCKPIYLIFNAKFGGIDKELLHFLVNNGVDLDQPVTRSGRSLGAVAIARRDRELFNLWLQKTKNLNLQDCQGWAAIHVALSSKNVPIEFFDALVEAGADVNLANNKKIAPIHQAVTLSRLDLTKRLIDLGAKPEALTINGKSALDFAFTAFDWSMIALLISKGVKKLRTESANGGWSFFHVLAHSTLDKPEQFESIRELVKLGSDAINAQDTNGWTPLHIATLKLNVFMVELFLKSGATVEVPTKLGWTPLHTLAKIKIKKGNISPAYVSIVDLLIKHCKDINVPDGKGHTPLELALIKQNTFLIEKLKAGGATAKLLGNKNAAFLAINFMNTPLLEMLTEEQFAHTKGRRHWTPLHLAAWEGQDHLVKAMINKGVDLFAIDGLSRTALHLAVQRRNRRVVRLLMQAGGETLAIREDDNGDQAIDIATGTERYGVKRILSKGINKSYRTPIQDIPRNSKHQRKPSHRNQLRSMILGDPWHDEIYAQAPRGGFFDGRLYEDMK